MRSQTRIVMTLAASLLLPATAHADIAPGPGLTRATVANYFTGVDAVPEGMTVGLLITPSGVNAGKVGLGLGVLRDAKNGFKGPAMAGRDRGTSIRLVALTEAQLLEVMRLNDAWLPPGTPVHPNWKPKTDAELLKRRAYFRVDSSRPGNHKLRAYLLSKEIASSIALPTEQHVKRGENATAFWLIKGVKDGTLQLERTTADKAVVDKPAADRPATDKPAADDKAKADDKPATDTPAPDKPADAPTQASGSKGCSSGASPAPLGLLVLLSVGLWARVRRSAAA